MSKTISHQLLEQIGDPRKLSQRNLDNVLTYSERALTDVDKGLTTKILSIFIPKEGISRLLSFNEVMKTLGSGFSNKENTVQTVLDKLEEGKILSSTDDCAYRISSNALAAQLYNKIEADRMVLRKVENFIHDRYTIFEDKKVLLTQQDLNYIGPYLNTISPTKEELDFIEKSRDELSQKKKRRAFILTFIISILSLLSLFATWQYLRANKALKAEEKATLQAEADRAAAVKLARENEILALQKTAEADSIRVLLARNEALAKQAREEAQANAILARDNQMLAEANRIKADSNATLAFLNAQYAEEAAKRAVDYEKLAAKKAALAEQEAIRAGREEELKNKNKALQLIAFSHSLAKQAAQMGDEQAELKSLLSHTAFKINEKTPDGDIFQQDIYDALYQSVKSINQAKGNDNFNKILNERGSIQSIAFAKTKRGKVFYTISSSGLLKRWTVQKWNDIEKPSYRVENIDQLDQTLNTLALSADDRWLAVGGELSEVLLYDLKAKDTQPISLELHDGMEVFGLQFLPNGKSLFTLGADKTIKRYDIASKNISTVVSSSEKITAFTLSADAPHLLYYGTASGKLYEDDLTGNSKALLISSSRETAKQITAIDAVFNKGRRQLFVGHSNGLLKIIEAEPGGIFSTDKNNIVAHNISRFHTAKISSIKHNANGQYIGVTSYDGRSTLWNVHRAVTDLYYQPMVFAGSSWATAIGFSEETPHVIVGSREGELVFFNPDPNIYAKFICENVKRIMEPDEWDLYIGEILEPKNYLETCKN
ncbi:MAG: hypothetical protein AB8F74_20620 [Saprospiraceae bacterium]